MATTPVPEEAAPVPQQSSGKTGSTTPVLDQAAVAASTTAANANGGQGAQPGGPQDPPLI